MSPEGGKTMKKTLTLMVVAAGLLLVSHLPAAAQDREYPRAEVHLNYSYLRTDLLVTEEDANGWQAGLTYNFHKHVGAEFDAAGHYGRVSGVGFQRNTFMAGPRFSIRRERVNPWVHGLFGLANTKILGASSNDFAAVLGGGLDINVNDRFAVRAAQLDYLFTQGTFGVSNTHNMRFSAGVVIKF